MKNSRIVIVDYGMGNLRSVAKAFEKGGVRPAVTADRVKLRRADKIVLPGVGAFTAAASELERRGLFSLIKERILAGVPYLGLCLGLQLLFDSSDENIGKKRVAGFGIIPGRVRRFGFGPGLKVPHMGWNSLKLVKKGCPLFKAIGAGEYFYFVHSYHGVPSDRSWVLAETDYGGRFCSAVWKGNVFATQFHPEKSQQAGLRVIKNFIECRG